jgi:16S rRNA (uracil1498-N3)-methyltransferase
VQAVVKSEAMDTIIQKATELGVSRIAPIITQYCVVRLDDERIAKRLAHWERIARSACEQSGRHLPPEILEPIAFEEYLRSNGTRGPRLMLDPHASTDAMRTLPTTISAVDIIIGPEGGFGPRDEAVATEYAIHRLRVGPRVLRADTAAIAACAFAQQRWGDLAVTD